MPEEFRRFDTVTLSQRPGMTRTDEGYLKGDAIVTRTGIFLYKNPDGTIRKELRHPTDVFSRASMDTLKMIPVVLGHPDTIFVDSENVKDLQVGTLGESIFVDGDFVVASLVITDAEAIKAIEQGRRELSLGYVVNHDNLNGGDWEGQQYDFKQVNIRYNHLAIVNEARAGAMARLHLDQSDAFQTDQTDLTEVQMPDKLQKTVIDGISYDAAPEVINRLDRETKRADAAEKTVNALVDIKVGDATVQMTPDAKTAVEKLQGDRDGLKEKLDAAEKTTSPEAIQKAAVERQRIVDAAKRVVDEETVKKLDGMNNVEIMTETVVGNAPKDKRDAVRESLKDRDDGYIEGRFEQVADTLSEKKTTVADQRRATTDSPNADGDGDKTPNAAKSRQAYVDRLNTDWQDKDKSDD
jgi:hypothetical protein